MGTIILSLSRKSLKQDMCQEGKLIICPANNSIRWQKDVVCVTGAVIHGVIHALKLGLLFYCLGDMFSSEFNLEHPGTSRNLRGVAAKNTGSFWYSEESKTQSNGSDLGA